MSKRDDEPSDMEVGMTTAERRRRRRRGGGLRVPSDNVPRTTRASTAPPVVAPVPEDPALAMSIAYSFTNDGSEPVPRVDLAPQVKPHAKPAAAPAEDVHTKATVVGGALADLDVESMDSVDVMPVTADELEPGSSDDAVTQFAPPVAPEGSATVIDPPAGNAGEAQEFEMKTREMSAVDLEALGLSELAPKSSGQLPAMRPSTPPPSPPTKTEGASGVEVRFKAPTKESPKLDKPEPLDTPTSITAQPDPAEIGGGGANGAAPRAATDAPSGATGNVRPRRDRIKTVALSDDDLEEVREVVRAMSNSVPPDTNAADRKSAPGLAPPPAVEAAPSKVVEKKSDEILSVPDIDIQMLSSAADADSADSIDIEINDKQESGPIITTVPTGDPMPPRTITTPTAATAAEAMAARPRAATVPPTPPPAATKDPTTPIPKVDAKDSGGHPPPPPQHKAPPAPPPAATAKTAKPAAAPTPPPGKAGKAGAKPWFVDLFDEDYLRTLPFLTPQATQAEAEFVIDAMGLQPGAQVLDLGCGYGRHAMELAARGFHMVGLDISTPLLVRGGEEAHRRGLTINFVRGDMRELDFDAQFDGAYCLFSTFGYFDDETNKKTVTNIARALKPGGRVMIEILNRDYVIADLPTRIWWEGEGCVVLEEVELNYFSSRIQVNRSVVFDDGRQLEQEISVRAYSLHEVGKLMHAAGFRVLEVSGGYQTRGRFFGNQSRHIIVLAERKDTPST